MFDWVEIAILLYVILLVTVTPRENGDSMIAFKDEVLKREGSF